NRGNPDQPDFADVDKVGVIVPRLEGSNKRAVVAGFSRALGNVFRRGDALLHHCGLRMHNSTQNRALLFTVNLAGASKLPVNARYISEIEQNIKPVPQCLYASSYPCDTSRSIFVNHTAAARISAGGIRLL